MAINTPQYVYGTYRIRTAQKSTRSYFFFVILIHSYYDLPPPTTQFEQSIVRTVMAFNSLSNSKVFYLCLLRCVPCSTMQLGYEFISTLPVYRQLSNANTPRHDWNPHRSAEHCSRCKYNSEHYVNSQKPQVDGKVQKTEICIHNANVNTSIVRFVRSLHPNGDELRSLFAATRKWIKTKIEYT